MKIKHLIFLHILKIIKIHDYDDFKKLSMCCIYVYVHVCIVYINDALLHC